MADTENAEWRRYGSALVSSMGDVIGEALEEHRPIILETADYWLSLGLTIGLNRPQDGRRLLQLIESEEPNRTELAADADDFIAGVLE